MALLRERLAENPFRDASQWPQVARNLQESAGKTVTARSAHERIDLLISQYASEDRANLRKSVTENEYSERDRMLQEVLDLAREFAYEVRVRKKAPLRERAALLRKSGTPPLRGAIMESPLALFSEMMGDMLDDEASSSTVTNEDPRPASVEPTSSVAPGAGTDEIARSRNATARNESVLERLRQAREENPRKLAAAVWTLCLNHVVFTLIVLATFLVPAASIVIGALTIHECPRQPMVPVLLVLGGLLALVNGVANLVVRSGRLYPADDEHHEAVLGAITALLNAALVAVFIAGRS
ncbi:hypothetical protein HPB52_007949 [Rhipicephalus sanguineus]|uniref:Transmembrane protein n=1 Tax=Rhipicephalus sanguineus TaxID=34632 RepID=A0A9D4T1G1_RHISA|nr:hypothetical protein HPB52_007949 [Rhipicephalus sanguineus]